MTLNSNHDFAILDVFMGEMKMDGGRSCTESRVIYVAAIAGDLYINILIEDDKRIASFFFPYLHPLGHGRCVR